MIAKKALTAFAAAVVAASLAAQDEEEETSAAAEEPASAEEASAGDGAAKKKQAQVAFSTLPFCRSAAGAAEVMKPGSGEWATVEIGRFYPLGSSFRTSKGGSLEIAFGADSGATISGDASFSTRPQALGEATRGIALGSGTLDLSLPDGVPEGAFTVSAPGFTVKDTAGESRYVYETTGDGDRATVRCVTGSLAIEGRHFSIPAMRAANEVVIRTSHDHLATFLYGTSGDYTVRLDQGVRTKEAVGDDGSISSETSAETLDWRMSPATKVVITRSLPAIGERMSVHTMAFDASGEMKSECAFCEGRAEVNTGELVPKQIDSEELAKSAAEATATTEADDAGDDGAEEASGDDSGDSEDSDGE